MDASATVALEVLHELKSFICRRLCGEISEAELQAARRRLMADYLAIVGATETPTGCAARRQRVGGLHPS